ncbi:acyltransferase family protein [Mucilaginibacter auburnensis]|uniref:Peptidoglycan/LPS O-acetylase OafA/YrhL n=1 Tax=Mucilaginibacter auburnensis TaxID=1457233 RepID=A0A2H9VT98_9SPHI|nr:acyltransferase family protein [Mucilaginibacter auburnensis]PJJ84046.1 peptidoglycan/LPS O-acetylase OafA/YrhL [Mucilaginibacter auburnensis]
MDFRKDIQGLRALAFLSVFIFHLNSAWLPGGFIGVDVFFVISGYLITSIILHQRSKGTFSFSSFYTKRAKRIVPAQYIMLLIVALASFNIYLYADMGSLRRWLLSSALYFSNIIFATSDNYFGAKATQNPVLHTWSLSIEMQFYFLLPLLLVYVKEKYLKSVVIALIVMFTAYGCYEIFIAEKQQEAYFSLFTRIPEFLIGSIFSIYFRNKSLGKLSFAGSLTGIILIVLSAVFVSESSPFPGVLALVPCLGAGLLLVSAENPLTKIFSNKVSFYIGELSYSLYLWHWPVMALLRYNNDSYNFSATEVIMVTFLTALLSWLSFNFVENFFKEKKTGFAKYFAPVAMLVLVFSFLLPKASAFKKLPDAFVNYSFFGDKSNITLEKAPAVEKLGDPTKDDKVLFIGDSNGGALKAFLDYMGKHDGFSFLTMNTHTYPPIFGLKKSDTKDDLINPNQNAALDKALLSAEFLKKYVNESKIIIIVAARYDRIASEVEGIKQMANNLGKDKKLIIIKSFPKVEGDINPIKVNKGIVKSSAKELKLYSYKLPNAIQELPVKHSNVFIYDISKSKIFNNGPYYNDTVTYYDGGHINYYGQIALAKDLKDDFSRFFKQIQAK